MGRNLFSTEEILKLPVTTNKLSVTWDSGALFKKYSIVSYSMKSRDKDRKNLSYEQLSDTPAVSVAGFWAKYGQYEQGCTKFFVLVRRGDEKKVLESLGKQEDVAMCLDDLSGYSENLQKRIIASLAVNSLGKHGKNGMMYNNGQLLVCDDNNFGIPASRQELVCLKLEVNQYMNLSAKTVSFSHPKTFEDLKGKKTANSIASTYMNLAESYGATCYGVSTLDETLTMVLQGRVDATLNAIVSFTDYMAQHPDSNLKVVATTEEASNVAIPMRKGDETASLREAVNKAIEELQEDGTLSELSIRFFGEDISK